MKNKSTNLNNKLAVALAYDIKSGDNAPHLAAKGEGIVADTIIKLAEKSGLPIREDENLVEMLMATDVGDEIPVEAFLAVAEILRYIFMINGKLEEMKKQNSNSHD